MRAMPRELQVEAPELRLDAERALARWDWGVIFGTTGRVEVEIGIGKGRFLLAAAAARPEVLHLGVEWANKYLRIAELRALRRGLTNVRFVREDARELLAVIPSASVSAYYVFYPDPWPKKRHHKRRFLQAQTVDELARTLVAHGTLHVSTDHEDYWAQIEPLLDSHAGFARLPGFGGADFPLPLDQPLTNFEVKYKNQGRLQLRASWRRRPEAS
jgi:tRNA (guanine-N7-)-methyltransferase